MFEFSSLCVDRTFLLIYRDLFCVTAGNMPYHLVVQYCILWDPPAEIRGINTTGQTTTLTEITIFLILRDYSMMV